MPIFRRILASALIFTLTLAIPPRVQAYGILTHQMIIDVTWETSIVPVLRHYFPDASEKDILNARAYVYGGALIQDSGYYKSEKPYMADVTHYIRSGDFVVNLFRNVTCIEELAFAIGALSHYVGDIYGHRYATNPTVFRKFPDLAVDPVPLVPLDSVTYGQGKPQHTRVEFGFDVNELAHHRLAPGSFHQTAGIDVAFRLYALAFYQTYGVAEDFLDSRNDFKGNSYHWTAFHALPYVSRSLVHQPLWSTSDEGQSEAQRTLVSITNCVGLHENWAGFRSEPTKSEVIAGKLLNTVPKLQLIPVDPTSQEAYAHSVLLAVSAFTHILKAAVPLPSNAAETAHTFVPYFAGDAPADDAHPLANINLDTGFIEPRFAYHLTDSAYFAVLQRLAQYPDYPIPAEIRADVLAYFDGATNHLSFEKNDRIYHERLTEVAWLKSVKGSDETVPYPTFAAGNVTETHVEPLLPWLAPDSGGCNPTAFAPLQQLTTGSHVP
jgi:hypothetical protein